MGQRTYPEVRLEARLALFLVQTDVMAILAVLFGSFGKPACPIGSLVTPVDPNSCSKAKSR